jgi:hypothetical protein
MKKIFLTLFVFFIVKFIFCQVTNTFGSDFTGSPTSYTFSSTDVVYANTSGGSMSTSGSNLCNGASRRTQLSTIILHLKSSSASNIVIHGQSSGASLRTLTNLETSSTLSGTYATVSGYSSSSTINSNSACGTLTISSIAISANTFIRFTFSGNVSVSSFVITAIPPASAPSTQASNVTFSSITATSATVNWTNGNGSRRAVFMKEGTQGTISNPIDGNTYTANNNWNSGSPTGTQLGTSSYFCVYDGTASTTNITGLNPSSNYWVYVFEYNGTGSGTLYQTSSATDNPNSFTSGSASPTISISKSTLDFGFVKEGTNSPEQSYTISASFLSPAIGDITITAPMGYQVSTTSGSGFSSIINLGYSGGNLATTTIYVRFSPSSATLFSGDISNSGGGATTQNIAVSDYGDPNATVSVGDYGSVANGNWNVNGNWRTWDGSGWNGTVTSQATTSTNVWILPGTTINLEASAKNAKNFIVYGTLTSSNLVNSPSYIRVYGSFLHVNSGGFIGSSTNPTGDNADGISLDIFSTNLSITGTGGIYFSRVRTNAVSATTIINADMTINYHGATNQGGHVAALYPQAGDNNEIIVAAGKTLTFATWAIPATTASSNANGSFNFTITVNGTMTLLSTPVPNSSNPSTSSFIYGGSVSGKVFTLNIGSGGIVNTPEFYPNGTAASNAPGTGTLSNINISTGGTLNVSRIADFRNPNQIVTGGGTFNLQNGATIRVASADGISLTSATGPIQTSTRVFDAGSNFWFEGSAPQSTGNGLPSNLNNFRIVNSSGVTLASDITVDGILTIVDGSLNTGSSNLSLGTSASASLLPGTSLNINGGTTNFNGRNVTLQSNASSSARLGEVTGTLIGATNVTVQRFIPAKAARKWSLISSPIAQSLSTGWQQNVHITGAGTGGSPCPSLTQHTNGFDATLTNSPSLFTYDASLPSGNRWVAVANTNATFTEPGKGFRILVRGSRSDGCMLLDGSNPPPSAALLITTGVLSNADKNLGNFTITYNNNLANNWVFVGNPYPSHISFSALRTTNIAKINNTYAIYIPNNPSGVYTYWDGTTFVGGAGGNDATGNVLPNGSAFFVQSIGSGNLDLDFEEAHKTNDDATIYMRNQTAQKQIRVQYKATDNTQLDEVLIKFNAAATNQDIVSMNSGTNFITALKDDKGMVIQHRSDKNLQDDEVKLNVVSTVNGTYKLTFSHYEELQQYTTIFLKDNYTGTTQNIHLLKEGYEFTTDRTRPETSGAGRFSLIFSNKVEPAIAKEIKLYPNPAKNTVSLQLPANQESYTVKVTNISGKVVLQQVIAGVNNTLQLHKLATGTYFVELIDKQGNRTTQKLVKQ